MKRNFILTVCFLLSLCVNAQDKMGEFEKKVYVSEAGDTLTQLQHFLPKTSL